MTEQWLRAFQLTLGGQEIDSQLRVRFVVRQATSQSPDTLTVTISNLKPSTASAMKNLVGKTATLAAGYQDHVGKIYEGTIVSPVLAHGRENPVDTFVSIYAATNHNEYNFSIANVTLKAGSTGMDAYKALLKTMPKLSQGDIPTKLLEQLKFPRAHVMYGNTKHHLRKLAFDVGSTFHLDMDKKVNIIPKDHPGTGEPLDLNSSTGLIALPIQTNLGIIARVKLNPDIKLNTKVHIDQASIQEAAPQLVYESGAGGSNQIITSQYPFVPDITADGIYRVISIQQVGDTHQNDWFTEIACVGVGQSLPQDAATMWPDAQ